MSTQPWMKFYPTDWRSDPRLRMCGLAARGLWMEMIGLMHEAEPYGQLLISDRAPTDTQLAFLCGTSPEQITELIGELESAGVFSRNAKGVIYSRRMTRDEKKARLAKKNGKFGGNPTLCKTKDFPASDNLQVKPPDKVQDKAQKPEARDQKELEPSVLCPKRVRTMYRDDFEEFWKGYPTNQNMSKKQAGKVWQRLSQEDRQKAIDSLPAYNAYCQAHPTYSPKHAEGYLSQAKYEGHLAAAQKMASQFYARMGTKQWDAWASYIRRTRGVSPSSDSKGGWYFPSEWPPNEEKAA